MSDSFRCACGKAMPEPLQRVGDRRALCGCGQPTRLDDRAQAAYAERAEEPGSIPVPEPPRAAPPEPTEGPGAPEPAGGDPAPAGSPSSWSEAEIASEAQLPAAEEEPEVEPKPEPAPPPRARDLGGWLAG